MSMYGDMGKGLQSAAVVLLVLGGIGALSILFGMAWLAHWLWVHVSVVMR